MSKEETLILGDLAVDLDCVSGACAQPTLFEDTDDKEKD